MSQNRLESSGILFDTPLVSIVLPAYNEEQSIPALVEDIFASLETSKIEVLILVVNDGSTDQTHQVVEGLQRKDPRIHLIDLSRNFGHQAALLAGLSVAPGEAVICMDADGQHPPKVLPELLAEWRSGAQIVNTVRKDSADVGRVKRVLSRTFYRLFQILTGLKLHIGMADFRLLDRAALTAILQSESRRPFLRGTSLWVGFRQALVHYEAEKRRGGASSYSAGEMLNLARNGITGFSSRPLWIMGAAGLLASVLSFAFASYAVVIGLVSNRAVSGWASTVAIVSALHCLLFLMLGVVSVYMTSLLTETRAQPTYIIQSSTLVED